MTLLQQIISILSKEETRHFKLWLNSTNASAKRKDVLLFDYIRKSGEQYDDTLIFKKLYGDNADKNSFYRLKNRLAEDLGYHLALQHFDKHPTNRTYLLLSLHQLFMLRNQPQAALYYLRKAEENASRQESFELLDTIYASFIRLSADLSEINPEDYIKRQKENSMKLQKLREADQVLAIVTYRLKLSQNYGKSDAGLLKLLANTIREFTKDGALKHSKSFQTRTFRAISQALIQKHNFIELEKYTKATYKRFRAKQWFDKENHELHLQMLVYLINALFKNRKFRESLDYTETLGEAMSAFNNLLHDKYLFFYYNSLVINYAQLDIGRALKALDEMKKELAGKRNSYYEFFIYLNKANLLFFNKQSAEAIRNLTRLKINDHYKKADRSFQLKILVAECIMQCEAGDKESTTKRVEQVMKEFADLLTKKDFRREKTVLQFIPRLVQPDKGKTLYAAVRKFVNTPVKASVEDGEVIRYRIWLATKTTEQQPALNK